MRELRKILVLAVWIAGTFAQLCLWAISRFENWRRRRPRPTYTSVEGDRWKGIQEMNKDDYCIHHFSNEPGFWLEKEKEEEDVD